MAGIGPKGAGELIQKFGSVQYVYDHLEELDIKPEIEIFDAGMLGNVDYYLKKGVLKAPLHYQLVLDVPGGMPGNIDSINHLVSKLPEGSTWSITGIGKAHMPCMLACLLYTSRCV